VETPDDRHALADVLLYYQRVLATAHTEIEHLCAATPHAEPMAPRVKTLKTTLEKLRRQPELRSLAQIRDLAGMRVVVRGTRADQDELAQRIAALFPDEERPVKFIDRRAEPRAGYRAVHLEVRRDGILIEIQIRTELQHRWAELFERAADKLGRGLRYGEPMPDTAPETLPTQLVNVLQGAAGLIDTHESMRHDLRELIESEVHLASSLDKLLNLFAVLLERLP
jgi:ppGpp synthetase/RelA/SpoT-type nucleotidyltranferase